MKKIILALCAVLAVLTVAGVAVAGDRGHGPRGARMHGHFASVLDLTDDQKEALKPLHEDLRARSEPMREQLHQQMQDLEALLDTANPNPTEVGNKAIAAHATRNQLKALHEEFKTRLKGLLTDEQKAKLEEIEAEHGDERGPRFRFRHHGPGF